MWGKVANAGQVNPPVTVLTSPRLTFHPDLCRTRLCPGPEELRGSIDSSVQRSVGVYPVSDDLVMLSCS
jgi:hypothetical protein